MSSRLLQSLHKLSTVSLSTPPWTPHVGTGFPLPTPQLSPSRRPLKTCTYMIEMLIANPFFRLFFSFSAFNLAPTSDTQLQEEFLFRDVSIPDQLNVFSNGRDVALHLGFDHVKLSVLVVESFSKRCGERAHMNHHRNFGRKTRHHIKCPGPVVPRSCYGGSLEHCVSCVCSVVCGVWWCVVLCYVVVCCGVVCVCVLVDVCRSKCCCVQGHVLQEKSHF